MFEFISKLNFVSFHLFVILSFDKFKFLTDAIMDVSFDISVDSLPSMFICPLGSSSLKRPSNIFLSYNPFTSIFLYW